MDTTCPTKLSNGIWENFRNGQQTFSHYLQTVSSKISIIYNEGIAVFTCILPNALHWWRRRKFSLILDYSIDKTNTTACLYFHGNSTHLKSCEGPAILFLHGDQSHPSTMLHLIDIAQKTKSPVFSLYIPYDDDNLEESFSLIGKGIDKIEEIWGSNKGLIGVGHSKGAIGLANRVFVKKDLRIKALISIAGRLRVIDSPDKACHPSLQPTVNSIYEGIQSNPKFPLYQIFGTKDWNAPKEAMMVNETEGHSSEVEGAMHLNILYHQKSFSAFAQFLKASSQATGFEFS